MAMKVEPQQADTSAFPLLRLDQISWLDIDLLRKSQQDLTELLRTPSDELELSGSSFHQYCQQQYHTVAAELRRRKALERIDGLLTQQDPAPTNTPICVSSAIAVPSLPFSSVSKPMDDRPPVRPTAAHRPSSSSSPSSPDHPASCPTEASRQEPLINDDATFNWQDGGSSSTTSTQHNNSNVHFIVKAPRTKRRPSPTVWRKEWLDPEEVRAETISKEREIRRQAAMARLERQKRLREEEKRRRRCEKRHSIRKGKTAPGEVVTTRDHKKGCEKKDDKDCSSGSESVSGGDSTDGSHLDPLPGKPSSNSQKGAPFNGFGEVDEVQGEKKEGRNADLQDAEESTSHQEEEEHIVILPSGLSTIPSSEVDIEKLPASSPACTERTQESATDTEEEAPAGEISDHDQGQGLVDDVVEIADQEEEEEQDSPNVEEEAEEEGTADSSSIASNDVENDGEDVDGKEQQQPVSEDVAVRELAEVSSNLGLLSPTMQEKSSRGPTSNDRKSKSDFQQIDNNNSKASNVPSWQYDETFPAFGSIISRFFNHHHRPLPAPAVTTLTRNGRKDKSSITTAVPWDSQVQVESALWHQWKLYSTWREVMSDYATVFSSSSSKRHQEMPLSVHMTGGNSLIYGGNPSALHYRVVASSRPEVYNIVSDVLGTFSQWEELPADLGLKTTWNLLWTWSKPRIDYSSLLVFQRVNHIPNSRQLTRKDLLKRHLNHYLALTNLAAGRSSLNKRNAYLPASSSASSNDTAFSSSSSSSRGDNDFYIMPQTFALPQDYTDFVAAHTVAQRTEEDYRCIWIMKPVGLSRGRGIQLIDDVCNFTYSDTVIVQRYIKDPYLLDGYKFDLRLYVLVTSFQPLEAFIYKEGFGRLSTEPFNLNDLTNRMIHLTNASVQKLSTKGPAADNPLKTAPYQQAGGSKVSLTYVWNRLRDQGIDIEALWQSIMSLILKSLVCVEDVIPHQPNAFEVFGYDILIDEALRPWLLEVNASPSMARLNRLDEEVKDAMIRDTILLIDPLPYDRGALTEILKRRLSKHAAAGGGGESTTTTAAAAADSIRSSSSTTTLLHRDLHRILKGRQPRRVGEVPAYLGAYQGLCPQTDIYRQIMLLKKRYVKGAPPPPFKAAVQSNLAV